jgi:hypothetical protein
MPAGADTEALATLTIADRDTYRRAVAFGETPGHDLARVRLSRASQPMGKPCSRCCGSDRTLRDGVGLVQQLARCFVCRSRSVGDGGARVLAYMRRWTRLR